MQVPVFWASHRHCLWPTKEQLELTWTCWAELNYLAHSGFSEERNSHVRAHNTDYNFEHSVFHAYVSFVLCQHTEFKKLEITKVSRLRTASCQSFEPWEVPSIWRAASCGSDIRWLHMWGVWSSQTSHQINQAVSRQIVFDKEQMPRSPK